MVFEWIIHEIKIMKVNVTNELLFLKNRNTKKILKMINDKVEILHLFLVCYLSSLQTFDPTSAFSRENIYNDLTN